MPGAMSDFEQKILQSMAPGLAMTREGRMMMLQIIKAQMGMNAELSKAAAEYISANGKLDRAGWDKAATPIVMKNPLYDPRRIDALERHSKILLKRGAK